MKRKGHNPKKRKANRSGRDGHFVRRRLLLQPLEFRNPLAADFFHSSFFTVETVDFPPAVSDDSTVADQVAPNQTLDTTQNNFDLPIATLQAFSTSDGDQPQNELSNPLAEEDASDTIDPPPTIEFTPDPDRPALGPEYRPNSYGTIFEIGQSSDVLDLALEYADVLQLSYRFDRDSNEVNLYRFDFIYPNANFESALVHIINSNTDSVESPASTEQFLQLNLLTLDREDVSVSVRDTSAESAGSEVESNTDESGAPAPVVLETMIRPVSIDESKNGFSVAMSKSVVTVSFDAEGQARVAASDPVPMGYFNFGSGTLSESPFGAVSNSYDPPSDPETAPGPTTIPPGNPNQPQIDPTPIPPITAPPIRSESESSPSAGQPIGPARPPIYSTSSGIKAAPVVTNIGPAPANGPTSNNLQSSSASAARTLSVSPNLFKGSASQLGSATSADRLHKAAATTIAASSEVPESRTAAIFQVRVQKDPLSGRLQPQLNGMRMQSAPVVISRSSTAKIQSNTRVASFDKSLDPTDVTTVSAISETTEQLSSPDANTPKNVEPSELQLTKPVTQATMAQPERGIFVSTTGVSSEEVMQNKGNDPQAISATIFSRAVDQLAGSPVGMIAAVGGIAICLEQAVQRSQQTLSLNRVTNRMGTSPVR